MPHPSQRPRIRRVPKQGGGELLLLQLNFMSVPKETARKWARDAEAAGGFYAWDKIEGQKWHALSDQQDFDAKTDFFVHGTKVGNAISVIIDGCLNPTVMGGKCKDPVCGTPGVYFISMPTDSDEDIANSFAQLTRSGYCHGAMIITKLTGVPVAGSQDLEILPGMIANKKQSGGAALRQIAAHCDCIAYRAAVLDEELMMHGLMREMEHVSKGTYNIGVHESLRELHQWLEWECGPEKTPEVRMLQLQNALMSTPSKDPGQRKNTHEAGPWAALEQKWGSNDWEAAMDWPQQLQPLVCDWYDWVPMANKQQEGMPYNWWAAWQPQQYRQLCQQDSPHCQPAPQKSPFPPPQEPPPATVEQPVTTPGRRTTADEGAPVPLTVRPTQEKSDHEPMSNSDESQSSSKTLGASPASQGQPRQPHP